MAHPYKDAGMRDVMVQDWTMQGHGCTLQHTLISLGTKRWSTSRCAASPSACGG
jgi:hypothetical protein